MFISATYPQFKNKWKSLICWIEKWNKLTISVLHGLSLLGGFGDDFDHPALERTHFLSVAQEEAQQQAEMLPLVLIRDEQRLGAGEHLLTRHTDSMSVRLLTLHIIRRRRGKLFRNVVFHK